MSASPTVSGRSASKWRSSRFGANGRAGGAAGVGRARRVVAPVGGPRRPPAAPPRLQAHLAHQPLDAPARVPPPFPTQLGADARRAVGAPAGREEAADVAARPGLGPGPDGGDRAQPGVEAG